MHSNRLLNNYELNEICNTFKRAARIFRTKKDWNGCGEALVRCAKLNVYRNDFSSTDYIHASEAFKNVSRQKSVYCIIQAVKVYIDMRLFMMASYYHTSILSIYEENDEFQTIVTHYDKCKELLCKHSLNKFFDNTRSDDLYLDLKNCTHIMKSYEELAIDAHKSKYLDCLVKGYLLKALLYNFAVDFFYTPFLILIYDDTYPQFKNSYEREFVEELFYIYLRKKTNKDFVAVIKRFEKIIRIDRLMYYHIIDVFRTLSLSQKNKF
uniref:Uncharacterized protein n=1 Tax=viral metagenome TaxID=1070528 RepID=A0A6C0JS94_9ZZZZ